MAYFFFSGFVPQAESQISTKAPPTGNSEDVSDENGTSAKGDDIDGKVQDFLAVSVVYMLHRYIYIHSSVPNDFHSVNNHNLIDSEVAHEHLM